MDEQHSQNEDARLKVVVDQVSLEQALLDADVALARTRDLMLRLVELREQLAAERVKNSVLHQELEAAQALYDEIISNKAYRYASKAWALRRALGA